MDSRPASEAEGLGPGRFALYLGAALVAAFPMVALGIRTFFYRDFAAMWYPVTYYTRASLQQGELPLWNPYIHCGVPFQAQMGQWYPPFLIGLWLPQPWSSNVQMLLHLLWGGLGAYWLARRWKCGEFASAFAGMAYAFNGVTLSSLLWSSYIGCLAWLPWVVGCVIEAWREGGRWTVLAALASALQVLTGMPELTLLTWLFLGCLWLGDLAARQARFWPSATRLGTVILLAAGLTMVQMLPFFDLVAHSQRDRGYATTAWSMPDWGWANFIVPLFHCYRAPQGTWFQMGQDLFPSYYPGAGVLALAVAGAFLARTRLSRILFVTTLACWVLALGSNGYVYDWVRRIFPWIGIARFPIKFTLLPVLLVPALAALALEQIRVLEGPKARRWVMQLSGAMLFAMGGLLLWARLHPLPNDAWPETAKNASIRGLFLILLLAGVAVLPRLKAGLLRRCVQVGLLALLPLDAMTHSPNIAPTLPTLALAPGVWNASGKPTAPIPGEGRIMLSADAEQRLLFSRVADFETDLTGKRLAEWYNFNLLDMVPKVNGAMPLRPAHFDLLERNLYYVSGARWGRGLLDLLSVTWVTDPNNPVQWLPRTNSPPWITAGQAPLFAADDEALRTITADDFDPLAVVCLPTAARSLITVTNRTACTVREMKFGNQRVQVDTECGEPSLVVVSQTFYHLWQAFVDGQPTPLWRANVAFQALQVPSGKHRVTLVYRDHNLIFGEILSALALLVCAWIWWRTRARGIAAPPQ